MNKPIYYRLKLLSFLFILLLLSTGCGKNSTDVTHDNNNNDSIAWQRANSMGMGINLAWLQNTWIDPSSIANKKQQLALMHQLGFKTLRLPVAFNSWTSHKPPYHIRKTYFFTLIDSVLKWSKLYDLNVIIDNHNGSLDDATKVLQRLPRVKAIWRQVATRYKNTDPYRVFFELYNEPNEMSDEQWKQCASQLIKTVRSVAPNHTIIIGGESWNKIPGLKKLGKLPFKNIIYTFHFYVPFLFTHQGATWSGEKATSNIDIPFPYKSSTMPPLNPKSKGTSGESLYKNYKQDGTAANLKKKLDIAKDFSKKYGVPIFCGEWGSYKKYADLASRCHYTATIKNLLDTLDIPFTYWEWNQEFSFFEGKPSLKNIPTCMKKAWGFK